MGGGVGGVREEGKRASAADGCSSAERAAVSTRRTTTRLCSALGNASASRRRPESCGADPAPRTVAGARLVEPRRALRAHHTPVAQTLRRTTIAGAPRCSVCSHENGVSAPPSAAAATAAATLGACVGGSARGGGVRCAFVLVSVLALRRAAEAARHRVKERCLVGRRLPPRLRCPRAARHRRTHTRAAPSHSPRFPRMRCIIKHPPRSHWAMCSNQSRYQRSTCATCKRRKG